MVRNGKYYIGPQPSDDDFKSLFARLSSAGAGRPVDDNGQPIGPWTPNLLAEEIAQLDPAGTGVDPRTVQLWFQENDKGISAQNIRWLAKVFGCGDPDASSKWQVELSAAQARLSAKRRRQDDKCYAGAPVPAKQGFSMARLSESLFDGRRSLNLPIVVWSSASIFWFLSYIFGIHSITYSPIEGLNKQVGFFWSPSWIIGEMLLLPFVLIIVSELLAFWKDRRPDSLGDSWASKIESYRVSYWAIFLICFVAIFAVQWAGVYLLAFIQGAAANGMVDWLLVSIERPEVVSRTATIYISALAFLYSGMIYWFYFIGLLLLFTIASDFNDTFTAPDHQGGENSPIIITTGTIITLGVFRATVFGILLATTIKLNAAYLITDAETIMGWLVNDTLFSLGRSGDGWHWLNQSPSPFFTSFLLLAITCVVFFTCLVFIFKVIGEYPASETACIKVSSLKMACVVIFLAANYLLIGKFYGFSLLLGVAVLLAVYSLFRAGAGVAWQSANSE